MHVQMHEPDLRQHTRHPRPPRPCPSMPQRRRTVEHARWSNLWATGERSVAAAVWRGPNRPGKLAAFGQLTSPPSLMLRCEAVRAEPRSTHHPPACFEARLRRAPQQARGKVLASLSVELGDEPVADRDAPVHAG